MDKKALLHPVYSFTHPRGFLLYPVVLRAIIHMRQADATVSDRRFDGC
jgi:hypothetical protein